MATAENPPVIDSLTFSQPVYNPGDTITATVKYHDPDAKKVTATGVWTDHETHASQPFTGTFKIADPCNGGITDDAGHTYTVVSDDNVGTAVLTTVA